MNNKGISIIELIIVIAILAIMVGVSTVSMRVVSNKNVEKAARTFEKCIDQARVVSMAKGRHTGRMLLAVTTNNELVCGINGQIVTICDEDLIQVNNLVGGTTIEFNTAGQIVSWVGCNPDDIEFVKGNKKVTVKLQKFSGKAELTYN